MRIVAVAAILLVAGCYGGRSPRLAPSATFPIYYSTGASATCHVIKTRGPNGICVANDYGNGDDYLGASRYVRPLRLL